MADSTVFGEDDNRGSGKKIEVQVVDGQCWYSLKDVLNRLNPAVNKVTVRNRLVEVFGQQGIKQFNDNGTQVVLVSSEVLMLLILLAYK